MLLNINFNNFPFWPMRPMFGIQYLTGLLAIVGVVFTVIMLIDCLKREPGEFAHPISKGGQHDKVIWAVAMVLSLSLYFVGPIVYFFVVYMAKKDSDKTS
jgi:hypothetical protein